MISTRIAAGAVAATLAACALGVLTGTSAHAMPCWDLPSPPPGCFDPNDPGEDPAPEPPAMPTNVTAPAILQTLVTIAWKDNAGDEAGFRVTRRHLATGATSTFTTAANATSFTDTGAAAATQYRYSVSAFNGNGSSGAPTVDVTTHEQPADVIGAATGSVVTGTNWYTGAKYSYVTLSGWALDFDRMGAIDVRIVQDGSTVLQTVPASTAKAGLGTQYPGYGDNHAFTAGWIPLSTVKGGHTVCAVGVGVGGGADKQLGCVSYTSPGAPSAPTDLVITPKTYTTEVTFTDRADDETGWYLQRSLDDGGNWVQVASGGATAGAGGRVTAVDWSTFTQPVCYRVLAVNSYGQTASVKTCR